MWYGDSNDGVVEYGCMATYSLLESMPEVALMLHPKMELTRRDGTITTEPRMSVLPRRL